MAGATAGEGEDASEFEVVEVHDWSKTLSDWRRPDGAATTLGKLPIEDHEVSPPDALDDMEPDEEHFHEATGNEGASFDRTYARAALVVWPGKRILAVLNQGGLEATLPFLEELAGQVEGRWRQKGIATQAASRGARRAYDCNLGGAARGTNGTAPSRAISGAC